MSDAKNHDDAEHSGHGHDTFVISAEDMASADRLQQLLVRASRRTQLSSERADRAAARLGEAVNAHDQALIPARRLEFEVSVTVFEGWLGHQDRLIRQLGHLDTVASADAANTHSAAVVRWTKVLAAATVVLALATLALIWATLTA